MKTDSRSRVYEFGRFRLDAASHRLSWRETGEAIALTPRAVLLLITLVCSNGRLLTKDELFDRVWAGTTVDEGNLTQTISVLRKALGDDTKRPDLIRTVPARGYQFIAAVTEAADVDKLDLAGFHKYRNNGAVNTAAYRSYIRARSFWNKRTKESLKQAVEHFEEAIREQPDFSYAYAGLADSHRLLADFYAAMDTSTAAAAANGNSGNGDKHLAEAYTTLAYAQAFYEWDWSGAERSFKQALKLDPGNATARQWYADYLGVIGRFAEARKHIDQAIRLEPHSPVMATALAAYFYTQRDAANLIRQSKKVIELAPDVAYGHFYLGFGYEFAGREEEAVDAFAAAATAFGEPPEVGRELIAAYRQNGITGLWHKRLDQYETLPHLKNYPTYLKSLVPIRLGDKETSLAWLEQACEQRDRGIIYAKYEPLLEPLRDDPRFHDLIHRIGLTQA